MTFLRSEPLQEMQQRVLTHPMYSSLQTIDHLRHFMAHHVFAVWDFMSLLKRLQQQVTCVTVPWFPSSHDSAVRMINEIVLAEESDEDGNGGYASHFQLYVEAMQQCGASQEPIQQLLQSLTQGTSLQEALSHPRIPVGVRSFVTHTIDVATNGKVHEVAAAFFFGREDLIPELFQRLVVQFEQQGIVLPRLAHYLQRHIELDGDTHGPLAEQLLSQLCGTSQQWEEATKVAIASLRHRAALWDSVCEAIDRS